jgi:hypothetical protein
MTQRRESPDDGADPAVAEYKSILREVLENRPSGTRRRLAAALGKNPSFISQISNPSYAVPIPASHVDTILEICHFQPEARARFVAAYAKAHPRRLTSVADGRRLRPHTIYLPDLGDPKRNEKLDSLVQDFIRRFIGLLDE